LNFQSIHIWHPDIDYCNLWALQARLLKKSDWINESRYLPTRRIKKAARCLQNRWIIIQ
jgi:hypothetical protein